MCVTRPTGKHFQESDTALTVAGKAYQRCKTLAKQPSQYQKTAAGLLSQGHQLAGILALQRNRLDARETHCTTAVQYGQVADDNNLQVASLILLGGGFYHSRHPSKTLQTYQAALPYLNNVTPLLQGRVYLGLAQAAASCGQEQEALRYLGQANELFPEHPENDPSYVFADCDLSSLYLWEGRTYLELDKYKEAWQTFTLMSEEHLIDSNTERVDIAIINHKAETAIGMRNLDLFCENIALGNERAKILRSEKRYQEACDIYGKARSVWPYEPRIKALRGLFVK